MNSITVRLDDELLARVDGADGSSRQEKILSLVQRGLDTPDGLKPVLLSTSQIASLDQTAARMGLTREETIHRFLTERILREFVDERNKQLSKGKGKLTVA